MTKAERKSKTASFTGHRRISCKDLSGLQAELESIIDKLISEGILFFISGAAIGFDTIDANAVLKARKYNPNLKLILALPCINQDSRWGEADKKAYKHILDNADEVIYVSEKPYFPGCMEKRNRYLVEHSGTCIAYMTRGRSGTSQTVRMANENGLTIINLADKMRGEKVMVDFEKSFGEFIDGNEYDKADEAVMEMLFTVVRSSYKAGFIAAGGEVPQKIAKQQITRPARIIPIRDFVNGK